MINIAGYKVLWKAFLVRVTYVNYAYITHCTYLLHKLDNNNIDKALCS